MYFYSGHHGAGQLVNRHSRTEALFRLLALLSRRRRRRRRRRPRRRPRRRVRSRRRTILIASFHYSLPNHLSRETNNKTMIDLSEKIDRFNGLTRTKPLGTNNALKYSSSSQRFEN